MPPTAKPIITNIAQITCGNCLYSDHHWQEKTVKCRKELDSELGDFAKISNEDFFCSHGVWRVGEHILKFSAAYHSVLPLDTMEVDDYTQNQNDLNAMESNLLNEIERVRVSLSNRIVALENIEKKRGRYATGD